MARPKKFATHRGKTLETKTDSEFEARQDELDDIYSNATDGTGSHDTPEVAMIKKLFVKCDEIIDDVDTISLTPGAKGDKGDTGSAGSVGAKGDKGDTGSAGSVGAKGDKGDTGSAGSNGTNGNSHLSAVKSITYDSKAKAVVIEISGTKYSLRT